MEQMPDFNDYLKAEFPHPFATNELSNVTKAAIRNEVLKFQLLCGLNEDSDPALLAAAAKDVREDGYVFLALTRTPAEFLEFFMYDDWVIYEMTVVTGNEEWALQVIASALIAGKLLRRRLYN